MLISLFLSPVHVHANLVVESFAKKRGTFDLIFYFSILKIFDIVINLSGRQDTNLILQLVMLSY